MAGASNFLFQPRGVPAAYTVMVSEGTAGLQQGLGGATFEPGPAAEGFVDVGGAAEEEGEVERRAVLVWMRQVAQYAGRLLLFLKCRLECRSYAPSQAR